MSWGCYFGELEVCYCAELRAGGAILVSLTCSIMVSFRYGIVVSLRCYYDEQEV